MKLKITKREAMKLANLIMDDEKSMNDIIEVEVETDE